MQFPTTAPPSYPAGERPFDALVVGGGIVGAGIARDAALRGLRTLLVEQNDFASGTSSRSSRLLHGGLRYLAQGRIGLVREASREKRVLAKIAPHLAAPLALVFPTYRGGRWPRWQLLLGVKLYDLLCGGRNLGPSAGLSRAAVLALVPGLNREGLTGGVRYFDGLTSDARLVLDTLRSAARHGAELMNYTAYEGAGRDGPDWRCRLRRLDGREFEVRARWVVNAAGPWAQRVEGSGVRLRLTKGAHLVFDRGRLPAADAVVMTDGPRILFVIPWGARAIVGTTDTDYDGPLDDVRTEPEDVAYLLDVLNRHFPAAGLGPGDVRASWAGLRPLLADPRGGPSDISRAHTIAAPAPGRLDVAGGKLTTYRLVAEQAVDRIVRALGRKAPCRTAEEPLLPADDLGGSGILPPPVERAVVERYCREEWAVHLDDVMLRRAGWHYDLDDRDAAAARVADWMADTLGWDAARRDAELARYRAAPH